MLLLPLLPPGVFGLSLLAPPEGFGLLLLVPSEDFGLSPFLLPGVRPEVQSEPTDRHHLVILVFLSLPLPSESG